MYQTASPAKRKWLTINPNSPDSPLLILFCFFGLKCSYFSTQLASVRVTVPFFLFLRNSLQVWGLCTSVSNNVSHLLMDGHTFQFRDIIFNTLRIEESFWIGKQNGCFVWKKRDCFGLGSGSGLLFRVVSPLFILHWRSASLNPWHSVISCWVCVHSRNCFSSNSQASGACPWNQHICTWLSLEHYA